MNYLLTKLGYRSNTWAQRGDVADVIIPAVLGAVARANFSNPTIGKIAHSVCLVFSGLGLLGFIYNTKFHKTYSSKSFKYMSANSKRTARKTLNFFKDKQDNQFQIGMYILALCVGGTVMGYGVINTVVGVVELTPV